MSSEAGSPADVRFMRRALALAERGLGETNPNPAVGCVLVRRGRVVGEGFHARAGSPHAEAIALAAAGARARGATAYVTLEPCAPHEAKRTPACAPRLFEAGVSRVVYGAPDLNPRVRGRGVRGLRAAGVDVASGVCAGECERLTSHFNRAMQTGRPWVTLKAGMTLDGRVATASGESKWITSPAQRSAARRLRGLFDGVLVGIGTVLADDPMLLPAPRTRRRSTRVVLDSRLRLPLASKLVAGARVHPVIAVCAKAAPARRRALEARGVVVLEVSARLGRVPVAAALAALARIGMTSLFVEGGSEVMGSFVRAGLFDEIVLFRAPLLLGGRGSRPVIGGPDPVRLADAVRLRAATEATSATLRYGLQGEADSGVEVFVPAIARKMGGRG